MGKREAAADCWLKGGTGKVKKALSHALSRHVDGRTVSGNTGRGREADAVYDVL